MSAVARLVFTYFTCRPLTRWLSGIGLFALIAQALVIWRFPYTGAEWGAIVVVVAWGLFFVGSLHMPTMIAGLNRSHVIGILPGGRRALFCSAFVTVLVMSMPIPLISFLIQVRMWHGEVTPLQLAAGLWMYLGPSLFVTSWLYVALGLVVGKRSMAGAVAGMLVLVVVVFVPTKLIVTEDAALLAPALLNLVTWLLFAAFLSWRSRLSLQWPARMRHESGREVDLILGTASPSALALPILVPVLLSTTLGKYSMSAWLLLMTIFSAVSGAIAASAASRSRAIWLRTRWTRSELFAEVERRFWRHNGVILAVLLVLLVAVGIYGQLPVQMYTRGLPLMTLGMALSTYLGLMQTQSLRLSDAALAVAVMVTLMLLAVIAAEGRDLALVYAIEIALAVLAVVLRFVARVRWTGLDWRVCRAEPGTAARSTA
jgi:hypothetical protein